MNIRLILLPIGMLAGCLCCMASGHNLTGTWGGTLKVQPGVELRLQLNVSDSDPAVVTLDSPDQGAKGIPCDVDYLEGDSIAVSVNRIGLRYSGALRGDRICGVFSQMGLRLPLDLRRGGAEARKRPQTPVPPFAYTSEEIAIDNPAAPGVCLAGTLTLPADMKEGTPVALLVSGSGLQDRDETLFEHHPFAVIADRLASAGIATLRYDDRGCGLSTGDGAAAVTPDFASDAAAMLAALRADGRFGKVGLVGHSEGALIGTMLGAGKEAPDFIVGIGAPAVGGDTILYSQTLQSLIDNNVTPPDGSSREDFVKAMMPQMALNGGAWMQWFLKYSPARDLARVKVPMLILYGERDRQVIPAINEPAMRKWAPGAEIRIYPGLNHLMQHCATGSPAEYAAIEETFAEEPLADIAAFILRNR